ncbi:MAG TPA: hypothetical protein VFS44_04130 [Gemmatimonadaceae bacterium]|nr:hypothetical protein [Gemmatimonadaceae bacterium]
MTRFAIFALFAAALVPRHGARAQIVNPAAVYPPALWVAGEVGYYDPGIVRDGATQSTWNFRTGAQWRASAELPLAGGPFSLGITGGYSRMPMLYYSADRAIDPTGTGVAAHADVWSLFALGRWGRSLGFHQIVEVMAGVVGYRRFRLDAGGRPLPPGTDEDFSIGAGYGFGYSLSPRTEITLVQDYSLLLHQSRGLPSGTRSTSTQTVLRAGVRVGLGSEP